MGLMTDENNLKPEDAFWVLALIGVAIVCFSWAIAYSNSFN